MRSLACITLFFLAFSYGCHLTTPISPGELAGVHAHLEGTANCTKCHVLGKKVSDNKCLGCHTYIKTRMDSSMGYHASEEVRSKSCISCHSDHHGKKFEIIHFDSTTFDHTLTGYLLKGAHAKQDCRSCHRAAHITDTVLLKRRITFLGLNQECLTCHTDYHQGTLGNDCRRCHNFEAFIPAPEFDHHLTDFPLEGAHTTVACLNCHPKTVQHDHEIQLFAGIAHNNCINCHVDVHKGKFGPDCKACHNEDSFHSGKVEGGFDHSKTGFSLQGAHATLACVSCHKSGSYTQPVAHGRCVDCHDDYHRGVFRNSTGYTHCESCHDLNTFKHSSFTPERHEHAAFQLEGAHRKVKCETCHLKSGRWRFRNIGSKCVDCHTDIHKGVISEKYYPGRDCSNCHVTERWATVHFDHNQTGFKLEGMHARQTCRDCHFKDKAGHQHQAFNTLDQSCVQCHKDIHFGQFEQNGKIDCSRCHAFDNWQASRFNHDQTAFKLDGKHKDVACIKCHPVVQENNNTYIQYKLKTFRCEDCH